MLWQSGFRVMPLPVTCSCKAEHDAYLITYVTPSCAAVVREAQSSASTVDRGVHWGWHMSGVVRMYPNQARGCVQTLSSTVTFELGFCALSPHQGQRPPSPAQGRAVGSRCAASTYVADVSVPVANLGGKQGWARKSALPRYWYRHVAAATHAAAVLHMEGSKWPCRLLLWEGTHPLGNVMAVTLPPDRAPRSPPQLGYPLC